MNCMPCRRKLSLYLLLCFCLAYSCEGGPEGAHSEEQVPDGAVWISGGVYQRGASQDGEYPREYPAHMVEVGSFYMDSTEVSNAQYAAFAKETGYITIAERSIDWSELSKQLPPGVPRPHDSLLLPGSLVFDPPSEIISLSDHRQWWSWKTGVNWRQPEGEGSSLEGRMDHPVVHIAYDDAKAYCDWKGGRLPTEAEWEYAARGGLSAKRFAWGDEDPREQPNLCNIWQGPFPILDEGLDGYRGTAPVASYAPNTFGLYDMAGNVWEWCSDLYSPYSYQGLGSTKLCYMPEGPKSSFDPREPYGAKKRVIKGGSYLCHVSYCENYRPSSREAGAEDTGMPHLGFRCVYEP